MERSGPRCPRRTLAGRSGRRGAQGGQFPVVEFGSTGSESWESVGLVLSLWGGGGRRGGSAGCSLREKAEGCFWASTGSWTSWRVG